MSDFEKNDELKRKYDEVMDSIADDINQINLGSGDVVSSDDFIQAISDVDFDNPDEVLNSVNSFGNVDTAPLFNDTVFMNEFGTPDSDVYSSIAGSDIDLSNEAFDNVPDTMTCDECKDLLYDYVSDLTDESESRAIEAHLRSCEMCRVEIDDIRDMISVMSSSKVPAPSLNLMDGIHEKLQEIAHDVKAEYKELHDSGSVLDKAKNVFDFAKGKTDYFIKHANWKVLAPAALSAVLVVGVASSGLYQVMKSSDEIYNFSDDSAISAAKATAKPSASGLDEYVNGSDNKKASPVPKSSSVPKTSKSNGTSSSASPRATTRPSSSPSTSSGLPSISSSGTSSSSNRTSSSNSSSSRTSSSNSSSSSSASRTSSSNSSSSSSSSRVSVPTATPKPYVVPNIILPDIASIMSNNSSAAVPNIPEPESFNISGEGSSADNIVGANGREAEDIQALTSGGGGNSVYSAQADTVSGGAPEVTANVPTPKPAPTSAPASVPSASASAATSSATPAVAEDIEIKRNEDGATESYVERLAVMDDASVVSCMIDKDELYNKLMNSSLAICSKIEENGEVILYYTGSEFVEFTKFLKENDLDYTLMVLGKNEDVKVILHKPEDKSV